MTHDSTAYRALAAARAGVWTLTRTREARTTDHWKLELSPELAALAGFGATEVPDLARWGTRIDEDDRDRFLDALHRCQSGQLPDLDIGFRLRCADDSLSLRMRCRGVAVRDAGGQVQQILGLAWDAGEAGGGAEQARLLTRLFEVTSEGLLVVDMSHRIVATNKTLGRLTGLGEQEYVGRNLDELLFGEVAKERRAAMWKEVNRNKAWSGQVDCATRDNGRLPVEVRLSAVCAEGGEPVLYGVLLTRSARPESVRSPPADDGIDPLTELAYASLFRQRLVNAIQDAIKSRSGLAAMVVGVDRFQVINETFGREGGDVLLRSFAQRLVHAVGDATKVCRLQGDRFALILENVLEEKEIERAFGNIQSQLAAEFSMNGLAFRLSASAGVAVFPIDGSQADALLHRAESALLDAKRAGRSNGSLSIYRPELGNHASEQVHIENNLRRALKVGGFECHLQPKVRLEGGAWVGAEALIRWRLGDCWISPARFIDIAEQSGLIKDLGRWMLWEAASLAAQWRQDGLVPEDFRIAVNLAGAQLESELIRTVRAVLGHTRLPGTALVLELTENILFANPKQTSEMLMQLKDLGVRLAIDDFGTGFTSMGMLRALPVDELKLDQSFVRGLPADQNSTAIARSVIALGESMGLSVVAEGIETEAQRAALIGLGCRYGQGYLFQRAMPSDEFEQTLRGFPKVAASAQRANA